jgi:hypothetical protein
MEEGVDRIYQAKDCDQRRVLENLVMNLQVP